MTLSPPLLCSPGFVGADYGPSPTEQGELRQGRGGPSSLDRVHSAAELERRSFRPGAVGEQGKQQQLRGRGDGADAATGRGMRGPHS